ncbi:site-specific recombinase XerD [Micromonospora sp. Llam0]|uniref:tyrosine-type recombinase/integrase n=1 Tax=Micromonospora sp. Llam0 TaxID=2485143 RepID=UPI000F4AD8B3|nr:tyrosine-type recombinase/integrase [Micromonospora sp. Llam0]ROO52668.1 site-specific recombinase XerD [Micromonospora sp. Llam0]
MSIRARAEQYLAMRRTLGFTLRGDGRSLLEFADRLDRTGQPTVTVAAAVAWASEPDDITAARKRQRLAIVRGFARYLAAFDPDCQVPPPGLLPGRAHQPTPYHYSGEEVAALVHAAGTIAAPLPAATMQALISLLAASGVRVGEALALNRDDIDPHAAAVTVTGKNDQTRLVPLHPTTARMLAAYAVRRDRLCLTPVSPGFFLTGTGRRVQYRGVHQIFTRLLAAADIHTRPGRRRPRIHDLRHTFAVDVLIDWYSADLDVSARLPVLSAFLGHNSPEATYWYLQATPQLLALAARRLDAAAPPNHGEVTRP